MAILEKFGKKMGEAAQVAAKRSSELMEITKININVSAEEDKEKKLYATLGKMVYERFVSSNEIDNEWEDIFTQITTCKNNIMDLKRQMLEVKNIKYCVCCGVEIEKSALFCVKCGAKQGIVEEKPIEVELTKKCGGCDCIIEEGGVFCPNCGQKIE